jgi:hypothetical protein
VKDSGVSRNNSSTHPVTNVLSREMRDGETVMLVLVDIWVGYYSLVAEKVVKLAGWRNLVIFFATIACDYGNGPAAIAMPRGESLIDRVDIHAHCAIDESWEEKASLPLNVPACTAG